MCSPGCNTEAPVSRIGIWCKAVKSSEKPLPGFEPLFSEIISKIQRKQKRGRGRRPKYNHPKARAALKKRSALVLGLHARKHSGGLTIRQQHNHIRAERAWSILSKRENGRFLQHYFLHRSTILAELGRIESKDWLASTAGFIAVNGLRGEEARGEIRKIRFGDSSPRSRWRNASILSSKIWKAVCQYRNLFPDITDEKIMADLKDVITWIQLDLKTAACERERRKAAVVSPKV